MIPAAGRGTVKVLIALGCISLVVLTYPSSYIATDDYHIPYLAQSTDIPNIIHYTQLRKTEHSPLHFSFEQFLALYSAVLFLAPDTIYIHTDHNASAIEEAKLSDHIWTRKVLTTYPNILRINHVVAPTKFNGVVIADLTHKSDFVRWEVLFDIGGHYMDWDVLPLRDVKALRLAGFNSVVGRQIDGSVNSGNAMTKPGSALAALMRREGPLVFDGGWETHCVHLITRVSERIAGKSGEILILDYKAWAPAAWYPDSADELYKSHDTSADVPGTVEDDPMSRWDAAESRSKRDWEMDFGQTYLLHAFKSRGHDVPGFKGITVPYVLARDSNYALAAWPAVQHMIKHGVVREDDTEL